MEPVIEFTAEGSTTVLYACPNCKLTQPGKDRDAAAQCCVCRRCGNTVEKQFHLFCNACEIVERGQREADRLQKLRELPIVEDDGGPVYVEDTSRWYENSDAAAEALFDDGTDPTEAIVFPAHVGVAPTPSLAEYVDEAWGACFEDGYYDELPKAAQELLDACEEAVRSQAPTMWTPLTKQRIVLDPVTASPTASSTATPK